MGQNFPTENLDNLLLCLKFFDTRIFSKHRRVQLRNFLVLWDNKFETEIDDSLPFSSIIFFPYQNISVTQKGSSLKFFGSVGQQFCDGKVWCSLIPLSALLCMKFFDTRSFPKHRRAPQRNVLVLWDRKLRPDVARIVISLPFRWMRLFDTQKFLKHRGVALNFFSLLRQKKFDRKSWQTLLCIKVFDTRNWYLKGSLTEFFVTVIQKTFDGKSWYPLPMRKDFRFQDFLWNTEGYFCETFRCSERTNFSRKIVILRPSPLLSIIP